MIILAIETSGQTASVALATSDKLLSVFTISSGLTHSQTLMPMVEQMLATSGIDKGDVGLLACSIGPGSFTGLRIGASVAKGMAMGLGLKIVPVSSLIALAYNTYQEGIKVVPLMDARRGEVYAAVYEFVEGRLRPHIQGMVCPVDEILTTFVHHYGQDRPLFLGCGAVAYGDKIREAGFDMMPTNGVLHSAASLARAAFARLDDAVLPAHLELEYIRLSQAEREALARG